MLLFTARLGRKITLMVLLHKYLENGRQLIADNEGCVCALQQTSYKQKCDNVTQS